MKFFGDFSVVYILVWFCWCSSHKNFLKEEREEHVSGREERATNAKYLRRNTKSKLY
jgi:hypothetical protein